MSTDPNATPNPTPDPVQPAHPHCHPGRGFDPALGNQLALLTLTGAINQQQQDAVASRNSMAATAAVLTQTIQMNHLMALRSILGIPVDPTKAS